MMRHCGKEIELLPEQIKARNPQAMSKQERSYVTIRRRILDGTYGPGYRLTIDALARELGMSQVPIREAIRRLEAEGWIVYRRNVGPQVSPIDREKWADAMETLCLLEGYATACAVPYVTPEDLDCLRGFNASMEEAVQELDLMTFSQLNRKFHYAIYARCPNEYLVQRLHETWARLDTIRTTVLTHIPRRARQALKEHEEIIRAIENEASFDEIERLARQHKRRTMQAYIDYEARRAAELQEAGPGS
jgi:DNA-binding GntR family transcriptional regulator